MLIKLICFYDKRSFPNVQYMYLYGFSLAVYDRENIFLKPDDIEDYILFFIKIKLNLTWLSL